jgi:hypothetical protein
VIVPPVLLAAQTEMLQYMPGPHRALLEAFERKMRSTGNLQAFVQSYNTAKGGRRFHQGKVGGWVAGRLGWHVSLL